MNTTPLNPGPGWRLLTNGERFREGDQYLGPDASSWIDAPKSCFGLMFHRPGFVPHRRRIHDPQPSPWRPASELPTDNASTVYCATNEGGRVRLSAKFGDLRVMFHNYGVTHWLDETRIPLPTPPPLTAAGHRVEILPNGDVKVGCTLVKRDEADAIEAARKAALTAKP